jgi:hypothetical protein
MTINFNYFKTRPVRYSTLFISATAAIIATGNQFELSKSDWSGWVQAIGSVAALGVAIFVMSRQNAHSAKLVAQADTKALRRRVETVSTIVEIDYWQIDNCFNEISQAVSANNMITLNASLVSTKIVISEVRLHLTSIPIHDLGSPRMAEGIIRLNQIAGNVQTLCDAWTGPADSERIASLIVRFRDKALRGITAVREGVELIKQL